MSRNVETLLAVMKVWNEGQDIDKVLSMMTEDIVFHFSAVTQPPKIGHSGALEFLTAYKARTKNPHWKIFNYAERGNQLLVEGIDEFDTAEGRARVPYMGIYEFRDGKISAWRDYFDRGIADRTMKGEKLPDHAAALADRKALTAASL